MRLCWVSYSIQDRSVKKHSSKLIFFKHSVISQNFDYGFVNNSNYRIITILRYPNNNEALTFVFLFTSLMMGM